MHVVMMTRGVKQEVDYFINELSFRYVPFKKYNVKTKKMDDLFIQMRVSPVQLWDISFPEDQQDSVLNTLFSGDAGKPINSHLNKYVWGLRKAMKLKPIPNYKKENVLVMKPPQNIETIGIGVKEDYWITEDGNHVTKRDKTPFSYEGI